MLASRGEYIGLLDADDLWLPGYLSTLMPILISNPETGGVYSGWQYIDANGKELPQWSIKTVPASNFYETIAFMNFLVPSGVLVRRACFDQAGLFDLNLRAVEDRDMWLRISAHYEFVGIPKVLVHYRTHGQNMTKDLERMESSRRAVIAKHFGNEDGDPKDWSDIRRRAYGGLHFRTALDHLEVNQNQRGLERFHQSCMIYPELVERVDTYYELGFSDKNRGFRGIFEQSTAPNIQIIFDTLESVFCQAEIPQTLARRKNVAYAFANFTAGLIAYNDQDFSSARKYLLKSIRHRPKMLSESRFVTTLLKTFLGKRTLHALKRYNSRGL